MNINIGDRVRYNDEPGDDLEGTVVAPTEEEVGYCHKTADGLGPDFGDVMVAWDDGERYWEAPDTLAVIES